MKSRDHLRPIPDSGIDCLADTGIVDLPKLHAAARAHRTQAIRHWLLSRIGVSDFDQESPDTLALEPLGVRV